MNPNFMTASQRERFNATGSCALPPSTPKKNNNVFKKVLAVTAVTAAVVAIVAVAVKIDSNNN